ncbi:MAG: OB-fold domain-containing protein [Bryobacteraceae bacterium]
MTVYSETLVWSPPSELAELAPYQLVLIDQEGGPRILGRTAPGDRVEIGDTVTVCAVTDGVSIFRKTK